jgi:hypothetical protein
MLLDVTTSDASPREMEDRWLLGWRGLRVEQIRIDFRLVFILGDSCELAVEQVATLSDQPGKASDAIEVRIVPESADVAPSLALFHRTVLSGVAFKSGALRVVFDSGHQLLVEPHPEFEAWTGVGPDTMRWVCRPGGGISVWT